MMLMGGGDFRGKPRSNETRESSTDPDSRLYRKGKTASELLMLIKLPEFKPASAANVMKAFSDKLLGIAAPMRQSMTYDQGREMAMYFCDPHSPWQRGSNENTNGLVHQYLTKRTDLSGYSQKQLDDIADQINNRPRKGLGVRSPLAVYRELLLNSPQHSTLVH